MLGLQAPWASSQSATPVTARSYGPQRPAGQTDMSIQSWRWKCSNTDASSTQQSALTGLLPWIYPQQHYYHKYRFQSYNLMSCCRALNVSRRHQTLRYKQAGCASSYLRTRLHFLSHSWNGLCHGLPPADLWTSLEQPSSCLGPWCGATVLRQHRNGMAFQESMRCPLITSKDKGCDEFHSKKPICCLIVTRLPGQLYPCTSLKNQCCRSGRRLSSLD